MHTQYAVRLLHSHVFRNTDSEGAAGSKHLSVWGYIVCIFPCDLSLAQGHAWQTLCCSASLFLSFSVSVFLSPFPPSLSVCLSDNRLTLWSFYRQFSWDPPIHFAEPACHPAIPGGIIRTHFGTVRKGWAQVCVWVHVCVHPPCHSRSFPTKRVPALCVCWLTGPKERRLFSAYPETLPCQVWDEILSIVLTPHSRASHSKTHTITALGGRVIPREKSVRGLFYTNT